MEFSLAPQIGSNPNHIYVKHDSDYVGKITPLGVFLPTHNATGEQIAAIRNTAASDISANVVAYGRRTGNCSCCGRELTNKLSISLGIGPICREKYGLYSVSEEVAALSPMDYGLEVEDC